MAASPWQPFRRKTWRWCNLENILVALITGGLTLVGVVITTLSANRKVQSQLEKAQAVTDTKIQELTREVRLHNGFAQRLS